MVPEQHITVKLTLSSLQPGCYRSRIEDSPAGASRGSGEDFELPGKPTAGYAAFLKEVDSGERPPSELVKFGKQLFESVFTRTVKETFEQARAIARGHQAFLRLAISALCPELIQVPWEYLHDGNNFLLNQPRTHIVRVLDVLHPQMAPFRPFRRLLVAIANPSDKPRFDSDRHYIQMADSLEKMQASYIPIVPATRASLIRAIEEEQFDAFYFLGHGELDISDGGRLFLEDESGVSDPLQASTLAQWFSNSPNKIYIAYFNSCHTGTTSDENSFAGVAQRILSDGRVPAVVAQQAPVLAPQAMDIAEAFLRYVFRGASPETAIHNARGVAKNIAWGIPVLYTHIRGPEAFERNRLECLLDANRNTNFVLILGVFRMGIPRKDYVEKIAHVRVRPQSWYKYPGDTFALTEVMAAWDIMGLLTKIVPPGQILIVSADAETTGNATHRFAFGSITNKRVEGTLASSSKRFRFHFGTDWVLSDVEFKREYRLPNLSQLSQSQYEKIKDFGIIEKVIAADGVHVDFLIAGLGDRATRGCARYLVDHWSDLFEEHIQGEFGLLLEFPAGLEYHQGRQVDRKTGGAEIQWQEGGQ